MSYTKTKTHICFLLVVLVFIISCSSKSQELPSQCYENQEDYSFMWWKKTIKTGNQIFAIKTSNYSLSFDYPNLSVLDLSINMGDKSEDLVLRETNAESFPENTPCKLNFGLSTGGNMSWCTTTSGVDDDCQLVETGKYFQRRFITNLPDLNGCEPYNSGLEIISWPDRLSLILKATPSSDLENLGLETNLVFPEEFSELLDHGDIKALKNPQDGSGYIFLKSTDATKLSVKGTAVSVIMEKRALCPKGEELNSGIIIYPVPADIESKIIEISEQEAQPLIVTAKQIAPIDAQLDVIYNKDKGWHQVILRSDETKRQPAAEPREGNPDPLKDMNSRMDRVQFSVSNPTSRDQIVRLNFAKGRLTPGGSSVYAVTGISAILRDSEGNPVGIPIQLSKNWHSGGRTGVDSHYFRGTWYHGLSMFTIPANSSISLEYTSVNSLWGGVPAASHAQLCLIGWGSNQQWDQSAIGAWGENITYEPDLDQASAPVLDFRPLLLLSAEGEKWGWTSNLGGADFFNYTKMDGTRGWHSRIRTQYRKYSPNLTEVTYAGTMDDNSMDFEYTASVGRSDDITRGIYKIRLNVLENISFKDFVIFQAAAERYHYTLSRTLAWGNETGLKEQWKATIGSTEQYTTEKKATEGKVQWFSFTDSYFTSPKTRSSWLPANRGFIIRNWNARINGKDNTPPWFAEYNTIKGHGESSGLINIIPPASCNSFLAGDYIEAEIVLFIVPEIANHYYGPNQNFTRALSEKTNTWELVYREAIGNDLDIDITTGTLINNYPIKIEADNSIARFSVTGGIGYVPLTISNVGSYRNPELYRKVDSKWEKVDQSVYGNDFWQTEYNSSRGNWDITYNINLDSPGDAMQTVEYKFGFPAK